MILFDLPITTPPHPRALARAGDWIRAVRDGGAR